MKQIKNYSLLSLDIFIHVFHICVIFFLIMGWIFLPARSSHLLFVVLVWISWIIFGFFKGFGYCIIVDTHNRVRIARGQEPFQHPYVKHVIDLFIDFNVGDEFVNKITIISFIIITIFSIAVNLL